MAVNQFGAIGCNNLGEFSEAVCIDAARIYDSCGDKDCLTDLRVCFTDAVQPTVDAAYTIKTRSVDVLNVFVDVEPVPFNSGFYSVDMTYFFEVQLDAYTSPVNPPTPISGVATICKKAILYGSEGCVKVFTNETEQENPLSRCQPKAIVQVAQPILLDCQVREYCDCCNMECCVSIPPAVAQQFEGSFENVIPQRVLTVTIGIFSIVQLERQVQMMIPVYDYCIPDKECPTTSDSPCDVFEKIQFPVEQFFPPRISKPDDANCGCNG